MTDMQLNKIFIVFRLESGVKHVKKKDFSACLPFLRILNSKTIDFAVFQTLKSAYSIAVQHKTSYPSLYSNAWALIGYWLCPFTYHAQEPAMLILKATGSFNSAWQHKLAVSLDKNSTVPYKNESSTTKWIIWHEESRPWRVTSLSCLREKGNFSEYV